MNGPTRPQIEATKEAIEVLRGALKRCTKQYKYGPPIEATSPL